MRIAICDDDIHELASISTLIENFQDTHPLTLTYEVFNSPSSLLNKVKNQAFDLLLLDVLMPEMTGIELAQAIRTFDKKIPIVFLTTSPEFAISSYRVQAKDYLLKPVEPELLNEVLLQVYYSTDPFLLIRAADEVSQIPFSRIIYLEMIARKITIYLTDNKSIQSIGTLIEYEQILLKHPQFNKPHRSYIVNFDHVNKLDKDGIHTKNGVIIPVPKANFSKTKNEYMNYLMK